MDPILLISIAVFIFCYVAVPRVYRDSPTATRLLISIGGACLLNILLTIVL